MTKATPNELITTAEVLASDHRCRYAEEILDSPEITRARTIDDEQLNATAGLRVKIDTLLFDLNRLHQATGHCPPTYTGRSLTPEWRFWTSEVNITENALGRALGGRATALAM